MRFSEPLESRRLFADFSVAFTSDTIPDSSKAGDKLKAPSAAFTVSKTGELTKDQGKAKLSLEVTIKDANGQTIASGRPVNIPASQLAKKDKLVKTPFSSLKVAPAAGTYTITATLGGALSTGGDTNTTNNSASTTFTTTAGSTGGTTSDKPWPNSQLGSILIFTDQTGGIIPGGGEGGFFSDFNTPSNIGTWTLSPTGKKDVFSLDFTGEAGNEIIAETASSTAFGGKAIKFGVDKSEAQGYIDIKQVGNDKVKIRLYFKQV